jgi:endonuclease/exonuclease/phosphatase family metal-dependent hydrolase
MPAFPKPRFDYAYDVDREIGRLRAKKLEREIPERGPGRVLLATWNVANFGQQQRREQDHRLIGEIMRWFDIVAIQEVKDDFSGLLAVKRLIGPPYEVVFSGVEGNDERLAFLYDSKKIRLREEVGSVTVSPSEFRAIQIAGLQGTFQGFDRNPYLATFESGQFVFQVANVHQFFGSDTDRKDIARRALETFAVARWAAGREKSKAAITRDILAVGDFNMPKAEPGDPIYRALTAKGLEAPEHSALIGSNLSSDKHYDQIVFFPKHTRTEYTGKKGVFDFDGAVFKELWDAKGRVPFNGYVKYYLSDHRPMWVEFRI